MSHPTHQQIALVTGANSGVGLELTKRLLSEHWEVIALIRSDFPADEAQIAAARDANRLRVYQAELGDFAQLKRALEQIKAQEQHIDVLFNNAGAAVSGIFSSPQGREMHFEVNTVVPYIILRELKGLISKGQHKTVVNTSSNALLFVKQFDLNLLQNPTEYKPLWGPYGASKLGLSLWTQEIAPTLAADGIEIRSMNPGGNKTKMTSREGMPLWLIPIRNLFFSHPRVGANRVYDVALGKWQGQKGVFINDNGKVVPLKFTEHSPAVFEKVHAIYEADYRGL